MTEIPSFIKMFPGITEVFANRIEEHSELLFPLFSIELNQIKPEWTGKLHMIQFNEDPYNTETVSSFNDYCKDCMIAFDLIDGKYSFKTDFKYFDLTEDWKEWFEKTKQSFRKTRETFFDTGKFISPNNQQGDIYEQIGGSPDWTQSDETPLDPDGNEMTFIAKVYTANYTDDSCDKDLYLFYSHNHQLAVLIYQST